MSLKLLLCMVTAVVLSNCSSTGLHVLHTSKHRLPPKGEGQTFFVACADPSSTAVEKARYENEVALGLEKYGWKRVVSGPADYLVVFGLHMDRGTDDHGYREIWGQTSSATTIRHRGTVHSYNDGYRSASYSGTTHVPATYGVVGVVPTVIPIWRYYCTMAIRDNKKAAVLQARLFTSQPVNSMPLIVPQMIRSYFARFPSPSGATRIGTRNVHVEGPPLFPPFTL